MLRLGPNLTHAAATLEVPALLDLYAYSCSLGGGGAVPALLDFDATGGGGSWRVTQRHRKRGLTAHPLLPPPLKVNLHLWARKGGHRRVGTEGWDGGGWVGDFHVAVRSDSFSSLKLAASAATTATHFLQFRGPHQPGKAQHGNEGVELGVALVEGEPAAEALGRLPGGEGGTRAAVATAAGVAQRTAPPRCFRATHHADLAQSTSNKCTAAQEHSAPEAAAGLPARPPPSPAAPLSRAPA